MPPEERDTEVKGSRIKKESTIELLITNNFVLIASIAIFILFFWSGALLNTYKSDVQLVINKINYLLDSRIAILKPA